MVGRELVLAIMAEKPAENHISARTHCCFPFFKHDESKVTPDILQEWLAVLGCENAELIKNASVHSVSDNPIIMKLM